MKLLTNDMYHAYGIYDYLFGFGYLYFMPNGIGFTILDFRFTILD